MSSKNFSQLFADNLKLCFLRVVALFTDLGLLALLAIALLDPALALFNLIVLGFLENFDFLFQVMNGVFFGYLFLVTTALMVFMSYYFCRFESSHLQGTPGKIFVGLKCSDTFGAQETVVRVAWRLFVQALLIATLVGIASLFASRDFTNMLAPIFLPTSGAQSFDARGILLILLSPYAMALFSKRGQSLVDLMVGRVVVRSYEGLPSFKQTCARFYRVFCDDFLPDANRKKIAQIMVTACLASWLLLSLVVTFALIALPVEMHQASQIAPLKDGAFLNQFKRHSLFKHLDLLFYLAGKNVVADENARLQSLSTAIGLNPTNHSYWYRQAERLANEGNHREALIAIDQAIKTFEPREIASGQNFMDDNFNRIRSFSDRVDEGALYSLRAKIEQRLGNKEQACLDFGTAYSKRGSKEDYQSWLDLDAQVKTEKASVAAAHLAQVSKTANAAYRTLLKYPRDFQKKKDLYNSVINLNNFGVGLIAQEQNDAAIEKFSAAIKLGNELRVAESSPKSEFERAFAEWQKALDLDKECALSWRNLSIAYERKAKSLNESGPKLRNLYRALYFDLLNEPARAEYEAAVSMLGSNQDLFKHHLRLAKIAQDKFDLAGVYVENSLALKIQNNAEIATALKLLKERIASGDVGVFKRDPLGPLLPAQ